MATDSPSTADNNSTTSGDDSLTPETVLTDLILVPKDLIESAIDALSEQAAHAEHWKGIRSYRAYQPSLDADDLRALIGWERQLSATDRAEVMETLRVEQERGKAHARSNIAKWHSKGWLTDEDAAEWRQKAGIDE